MKPTLRYPFNPRKADLHDQARHATRDRGRGFAGLIVLPDMKLRIAVMVEQRPRAGGDKWCIWSNWKTRKRDTPVPHWVTWNEPKPAMSYQRWCEMMELA